MISHRARRPDRWLSALLVPVVTAMVMALCACPAVAATDWAQTDVDLYVGDFNGDNKDDTLYVARSPDRASGIALSSQGSDGVWRPAAGHQSWASGYLGIPWFGNYYRPVIGDFNGDGKDDILMQRRTPGDHFLLLANSAGKFTSIAQTIPETNLGLAWSESAHRMVAGDFDGDGRTDLFLQGVERNSTHAIFQPATTGLFTQSAVQSFQDGYMGLAWSGRRAVVVAGRLAGNDARADLFVQARPDIVTVPYDPPVSVPRYRPNSFAVVQARALSGGALFYAPAAQLFSRNHLGLDWSPLTNRASIADFNGDGIDDIFLQSTGIGRSNALASSNAQGQVLATVGIANSTVANLSTTQATLLAANFDNVGGAGLYVQTPTSAGTNQLITDVTQSALTLLDHSLVLQSNVTAGTAVGSIPGQFEVDPSGAAGYSIPVAVPPGVAGMAPELSFEYSSRAGNSLLGVGWSLQGLSAISRCSTTYIVDGVTDGVDFDADDKFCLDGQRLLKVNGASGDAYATVNAEYRTEVESFQRVTAQGGVAGDPASFVVETKSGQKLYFGDSTDSRVEAQGRTQALSWVLRRVEDRYSNFVAYTYYEDGARSTNWPTSISYGSSGVTVGRVDFTYSNRNDTSSGYIAGSVTGMTQRLASVAVFGRLSQTGITLVKIREYFLDYEASPSSGLSHLVRVIQCDGASGAGQRCLGATTFGWQHGYRGLSEDTALSVATTALPSMRAADLNIDGKGDWLYVSAGKWAWRLGGLGGANTVSAFTSRDAASAMVLDVDSDGYPDLVQKSATPTANAPTTSPNYEWIKGSATGLTGAVQSTTAKADGLTTNGQFSAVGDFDGDGRQDIVYQKSFTYGAQLETRFFKTATPFASTEPVVVSSLTSDVFPTVDTVSIIEHTASQPAISVINFDGDGRDDLLVKVSIAYFNDLDKRVGTQRFQVYSWSPTSQTFERVLEFGLSGASDVKVVDANGDGLSDLLFWQSPNWRLYQSNGSTFLPAWGAASATYSQRIDLSWAQYGVLPSSSLDYTVTATLTQSMLQNAEILDYDGDGRQDILAVVNGNWRVLKSTGQGYDQTILDTGRVATNASQAMLVDDNADGLPDLLFPSGSYYHTYLSRAPSVTGVIETITDGLGATTQVQYGLTNDPTVYAGHTALPETNTQPAFPIAHLGAPFPVVYRFVADNTYAKGVPTLYQYSGLKVHRQGRGLMGFSKIRAWNDNTQVETINEYAQSFPYVGMVTSVRQKMPDSVTYGNQVTSSTGVATSLLLRYAAACDTNLYTCNVVFPQAVATPVTGQTISQTSNTITYMTLVYGNGVSTWYPYARKSVELGYPLPTTPAATQPAAWKRTTTDYLDATGGTSAPAYDNFGNPYRIRVTVDDAGATPADAQIVDTISTYTNDLSNWCLGRLTNVAVTHTRPTYAGSTNSAPTSLVRSSSFAYHPTTCVLTEETVEPAAGATSPLYLKKSYGYDAAGNRTSETVTGGGIAARTTSVSYAGDAALQFATTATNALGHTEAQLWDPRFGTQLQVTGPNGLTTSRTYDTFGRKLRDQSAVPGVYTDTSYAWCAGYGLCTDSRAVYLVKNTGSDGTYSISEFDRLGRQVRARKPHFHGYEVSSEKYYDPLGREYLATQPHGLSGAPAADQQVCYTRQKFDVLGRVIDTWAPSTAAQCTTGTLPAFDAAFPATGRFGHVQYDEVDSATGLLATTYITNFGDPSARTQQKLHNRMGRLRFVRDVLAGGVVYATEFDYDPAGNTSWVKDTAGNITRMGYDLRGRKTSMQDPDMGTWSYGYDALGQLTSQTDAKGQSTTITYDLLGRLLTRAEAAEGTTSWAYDTGPKAIGKLSSVAGTNGYEQAISYDNYGRPADTRTRAATGEAWDWVSQSYDGLGRPDVTTYPARDGSGSTTAGGTASERFQVRAVYAPSGDLWKLEERLTNGGTGTTYWTATGRSAQGALTDESLGNGLYTHQEVDRATGTLGSITTGTTLGGTSVQNLAFTFDAADNLTAREDRVAGLKESFTYDGLQRLSGASRYASLTATTPAETQAYSYDATGNLLGKGSQYTGYSYSAATGCTNAHAQPHAVRQVTAGGSLRSYCYDANGNLTTITGTNAGYTAVSWWASNLARRMSKGSTSAEFWYGPDRARVLQVATRSTESERTVYLGSLYERTVITPNTGSATTRHVHYVRAGDETLAIKTWSKVGTGAYSPQVRYLHRDHLGSVVAITTETGSVESRSSFDAWGKRRDPATWVTPAAGTFTAAPTATDRGYTGHEHVDELGLVHMNGRIYDPEIGKFLSADPTLQFPESTQGYNRYAYAGNNPLSYTDPSGFSFWKKLMSFVGLIINFIPGFQGWSTAFWRGFVTGFLTSGGNLKAALLGGVGGALFGVVGGKTMSFVQRALLHGLIGGSISALGGGKFGSGFLGAFAGGLLSPQIEGLLGAAGTGGTMGTVLRTIASAIVGGISSKLGGGKFLNGAAMAAFARLFNDEGIGHSKRYSVADNVELTPDIEEKVSKIGSAYYESTGSEIVVTSGTRTSLKQANAMYDRIQAGGDFSDYLNQDAAKEVREVYDSGVKAKLSRAEIVASMAGVIKNQVDSGVFISLHLKAGAVDIRSVGMSDKQVISFRKAAEAVTSSVALEQSPPHWHLQF